MYENRLRVIRRRLDGLNRDMTRDHHQHIVAHGRGRPPVPTLAHVKVMQAIVQVDAALTLVEADDQLRNAS